MFIILGFIVIFVFTYFSYKTAVENQKSGLWAIVTFFTGFVIQFVIPSIFLVVVIVFMSVIGRPLDQGDTWGISLVVEMAGIVGSVGGMLLILKYLAKLPDDDGLIDVPPPPKFN